MPSGDRKGYDRIYPVFEAFTERVVYTGRLGNGTICKLVENMAHVSLTQMVAETLTLGVKAGVVPVLMEVFGRGLVGSQSERMARSVFNGVFDPALFRLDLMRKDIGLATELGQELDVPLPLASFSEQLAIQAVNRGWGDRDVYVTMLLQEERRESGYDLPSWPYPGSSEPRRLDVASHSSLESPKLRCGRLFGRPMFELAEVETWKF